MSTKLFTSDLHFGHEKVAEIRGFDSVEDHDTAVWDSVALASTSADDLYILGDLVGNPAFWDYALEMVDEIEARSKHLILGNHDPAHPGASKRHGDYLRDALEVFDSVAPFGRVKIGKGQAAMLSHFPYDRERGSKNPRWVEWRLRDNGMRLIHGHLHTHIRGWMNEFHVGWDAWKRPATLEEVRTYFDRNAEVCRALKESA